MQKKIFAALLVLVMIFTLSMPSLAASLDSVRLNQAEKGDTPISASNSGSVPDDLNNNPTFIGGASTSDTNYAFWCFIANSGPSDHAVITFLLPGGTTQDFTFYPSVTNGNKNDHYNIITPAGYQVFNGYCYYPNVNGKQEFTLSHSYTPPILKGSLEVTANVVKQHTVTTTNTYLQRDVWDIMQRNTWDIMQRNVWDIMQRNVWDIMQKNVWDIMQRNTWDIMQRNVWDIMQRNVWDIYQKNAQPYYVPTFKKAVSSASTGTLVTRLHYSDDNSTTKVQNAVIDSNYGGLIYNSKNAKTNGFTYVTLNVAPKLANGTVNPVYATLCTIGIDYTIADSSFNNGKKTDDMYNNPINYTYNVKIVDGKLRISLDDRLISASVGAEIVTDHTKFSGNAPKHTDLPASGKNYVDFAIPTTTSGNIYLFVHFQGGITWYTTGNYEFVGWRFDHTDYSEPSIVDHDASNYAKVSDGASDYAVVDYGASDYAKVSDGASDYAVVDHGATDYAKVSDGVSDYAVVDHGATDYTVIDHGASDYRTTSTSSSAIVQDQYNATFEVDVYNSIGDKIYSDSIANHGNLTINGLPAGSYTVTLTGDDIGTTNPKSVTVIANRTATVAFNDIPAVVGEPVTINNSPVTLPDNVVTPVYLADNVVAPVYLADNIVAPVYLADNVVTPVYLADNVVAPVYLADNIIAPVYLADNVIAPVYLADNVIAPVYLPDKVLSPIYLGSDVGTNPLTASLPNPYAIFLN